MRGTPKSAPGFDAEVAAAVPPSAVEVEPSGESLLEFPAATAIQLRLLPRSWILEVLVAKLICPKNEMSLRVFTNKRVFLFVVGQGMI